MLCGQLCIEKFVINHCYKASVECSIASVVLGIQGALFMVVDELLFDSD